MDNPKCFLCGEDMTVNSFLQSTDEYSKCYVDSWRCPHLHNKNNNSITMVFKFE